CRLLLVHAGLVLIWKQDADGAAWGAEGPRRYGKGSTDKRGQDVKGAPVDRSIGCRGACQVEEDAGVRPLLEPWKTRDEYGDGSKDFPNTQYRHKVRWIAEDSYKAIDDA